MYTINTPTLIPSSTRHFTCKECLHMYVRGLMEPEQLRKLEAQGFRIYCPAADNPSECEAGPVVARGDESGSRPDKSRVDPHAFTLAQLEGTLGRALVCE